MYLNTGITSVNFGNKNTCQTKIGLGFAGPDVLLADFNAFKPTLINMQLPLQMGDDVSLSTILNTGSETQIKNAFIAKSPYISDRLLLALIRKNIQAATVKDIIIANSPITQRVKTVLDSLPLSNEIRNQINTAQGGISQRKQQEGLVSDLLDKQHSVAIDAMTSLLLDSVDKNSERIIKFQNILGGSNNRYQNIKTYLSANDVVNAQKTADTLLNESGSGEPMYAYLQTLINVYATHNTGAIGIANDEAQQNELLSLSLNSNEYDSRAAIGILVAIGKLDYKEWIQGKAGANNGRKSQNTDDALTALENIHFKVYPNPSAGVFYYDYNSEENNNSSATLTIIDMLGKVIIKGEINSNNSTGKIDLSELTNGIYFINVSTTTKQLFNNKLSVSK